MMLLEPICQLTIATKEGETYQLGAVITPPQLDLIRRCELQLARTGRIRMVVLKARQMGFSTIIEAILFVLAMYYRNLQALVVSHEKESSQHILSMTKRYWTSYPFALMHEEEYSGRTYLSWSDLGSGIQVATAKNVGAGRSRTLRALHASEVAFWVNGEELMGGLAKSIPATGMTAIFLESTANGVGNYFQAQWVAAQLGTSDYEPVFYPWHAHPWYTIEFLPLDVQDRFDDIDEFDEEEIRIRHQYHLTDGQLRWRRWAIANECQGSVENFHQEYPNDPTEAFLSTGHNIFDAKRLLAHYEPRIGARGKLVRTASKVNFVESPDGILTVYRTPSADRDWGMYRVGADPTHTQVNDYACAQVIQRRTLEQVAVLRMKDDPIHFAEQLLLLGLYYNTARLVPEKTGPGYATIGALAAMNYPDIWMSVKLDSLPGTPLGALYGWTTNVATKPLAIGHVQYALSQRLTRVGDAVYGLVLHDEMTFTELRDYVFDPKTQKYRNGRGSEYDDGVMALAIALATEAIDADLPAYGGIDPSTPRANIPVSSVPRRASGSGQDPATIRALEQIATSPALPTPSLDTAIAGGNFEPASPATEQTAPWEDWEPT